MSRVTHSEPGLSMTEVSHDEAGKNERFAVARRETHKRIASFKETKYDFSF